MLKNRPDMPYKRLPVERQGWNQSALARIRELYQRFLKNFFRAIVNSLRPSEFYFKLLYGYLSPVFPSLPKPCMTNATLAN